MTFHPLLTNIKATALTLRSKQPNTQAINDISQSFRVIQELGSLSGFDDVVEFAEHIRDLLTHVRAGTVPVTAHLPGVMLAAADQITLLLDAAKGGPPVDLSLQAALLETVFQMTEPSIPLVKTRQAEAEASFQDGIVLTAAGTTTAC